MRVPHAYLLGRHVVTDQLRIDAALADAPRNQLRVLPAEIDHEDGPLLRSTLRKADDLGLSAGNSAPPS